MKFKPITALFTAGVLALTITGCSREEDFDASGYTAAYLDGVLKGDSSAYQTLAGEKAEDLEALHSQYLASQTERILGNTDNAPGGQQISPGLQQDFNTLWEDVFQKTSYSASSANRNEEDSYQITLDIRQLKLYEKAQELLPAKMEEYSQQLSENTEDSWELYASTILETYQEALESAAYGEDETAQITLSRTDSDTWTVSSQDVDSLIQKLLDVSVLEDSAADTAQSLQTEARPDTADPEEIASADTAQVGQTVSLSREGTAMADFSIDRVEVTDERSEYDMSNPEKVVVITYTYTNTGSSDPLLLDEMSFTVMEGDSACSPYYLTTIPSPTIAEQGGAPVTAAMAYGVSQDCDSVTIYVDSPQLDTPLTVTAALS